MSGGASEALTLEIAGHSVSALSRAIGRSVDFRLIKGRLFLDSFDCDAMGIILQHWAHVPRSAPIRGTDFIFLGTRYHRTRKGAAPLHVRVPVILPRLPIGYAKEAYHWRELGPADRRYRTFVNPHDFQLLPSSGFRRVAKIEIFSDENIIVSDEDDIEQRVNADRRVVFFFDEGPELVIEIGEFSDPSFLITRPSDPRPYERSMDTLRRRVVISDPTTRH